MPESPAGPELMRRAESMNGRHPEAVRLTLTTCADRMREAEFNIWYDRTHIPDVLAGGVATHGTRVANADPESANPAYLALYELSGLDLEQIHHRLPTWCSACIATAGCWAACRLCDVPCGDVWAESLRWTAPGAPEQQAYSSSKVVAQPLIASVTSMSGTSGFTSLTFSAPASSTRLIGSRLWQDRVEGSTSPSTKRTAIRLTPSTNSVAVTDHS